MKTYDDIHNMQDDYFMCVTIFFLRCLNCTDKFKWKTLPFFTHKTNYEIRFLNCLPIHNAALRIGDLLLYETKTH